MILSETVTVVATSIDRASLTGGGVAFGPNQAVRAGVQVSNVTATTPSTYGWVKLRFADSADVIRPVPTQSEFTQLASATGTQISVTWG